MLVRRIEIGRAENQHRHFTTGPVSDAWRDQNGRLRFPSVQFDGSLVIALQNDVQLCVLPMVMVGRIFANLGQVNRSRKLIAIGKGPTSHAAGARDPRQAGQVYDFGFFGRLFGHNSRSRAG